MPITQISCSKSVEYFNQYTNQHSWKKFGAEYELSENENVEDATEYLKNFVNDQLKTPQPTENQQAIQVNGNGGGKKTMKEQLADDIQSCKDLKVLSTYEFLLNQPAYKDEALRQSYDKKFAELSKT